MGDNAMASAGVSSGPGADGTIPSSRTLTGGLRNSTDGAGCLELAQQWAQFNTSANQAAGSANGDLDTGAANTTTTILNAISSRTTLVADLQSCANGSRIQSAGGRQIETLTTIIQIRNCIFWCVWWRETVITVKITIITSTFSIETSATTSAATTSASATTASSAPTSSAGSTNGSSAPTTSGAPSSGSSGATAITIPFNTSTAASSGTSQTTTGSGGSTTTGSATTNSGSTPISVPSTSASGSCKCGIKKTTRIVGGSETDVNEYPWIAAFDFNGVDGTSPGGCAASLVANNWAVTASHCFYRDGVLAVTNDAMSLVLGVHDRTGNTDTNRKVLRIEEIVIHPSYSSSSNSFDIALLKISESVDLDAWSPACLPTSGADFTGQNGWVYGWGVTSENGASLADKLLEVEVPIVSDSVCVSAMSGISITSDMLCAGGENGKDACQGDSGGPFTTNSTSGAHTLVGAVSFGDGCAKEGLYGVYADVPFFRTWIDKTIAAKGGATFCS